MSGFGCPGASPGYADSPETFLFAESGHGCGQQRLSFLRRRTSFSKCSLRSKARLCIGTRSKRARAFARESRGLGHGARREVRPESGGAPGPTSSAAHAEGPPACGRRGRADHWRERLSDPLLGPPPVRDPFPHARPPPVRCRPPLASALQAVQAHPFLHTPCRRIQVCSRTFVPTSLLPVDLCAGFLIPCAPFSTPYPGLGAATLCVGPPYQAHGDWGRVKRPLGQCSQSIGRSTPTGLHAKQRCGLLSAFQLDHTARQKQAPLVRACPWGGCPLED